MGSHCDDSYHSLVNECQSYGFDHDFDLSVALVHASDMFNMSNVAQKSYLCQHKRMDYRGAGLGGFKFMKITDSRYYVVPWSIFHFCGR